ncbi:RNA polymerase sigma factor [Haloimpatiens sp. FM7330]|uniref:RNA polymerase sigma factor n=1 Tax=Haloimpatiens sp. FM7330 TaxID=3298610 RepID=UPI00363BEA28
MNDEEIIERIKKGDKHSFVKVVDLYKNKIISLCYSYTNDYYEAEDLSQEVFVTLYKNINKFRLECSLSTYIYKISLSKCIDYKRKKKVKSFLGGLLNIQKVEEEDLDEKNYIRQCINNLPRKLKVPIVLYYYVGLNQKEIGDILNISQKAVEGRIYRAKKNLKIKFEREDVVVCKKNLII